MQGGSVSGRNIRELRIGADIIGDPPGAGTFYSLSQLRHDGNSANIINAVEAAKANGMHVATLLGKGGGKLAGAGTTQWIVPGETSDRIQELHMLILHALVGAIERALGDG